MSNVKPPVGHYAGPLLSRLKLAHKLALGFGVCLALTVALAVSALQSVAGLRSQVQDIAGKTVKRVAILGDFGYEIGQQRVKEYHSALSTGKEATAEAKAATKFRAKADADLTAYSNLIVAPADKELFERLTTAWNRYKAGWSTVESQLTLPEKQLFALFQKSTTPVNSKEVRPALEALLAFNSKQAAAAQSDAERRSATAARTLTAIAIASLLLCVAFGMTITRSVVTPLSRVCERLKSLQEHCVTNLNGGLRALAGGDLTASVTSVTKPIEVAGTDEVAQMSAMFNDMVGLVQESVCSYNTARVALGELVGQIAANSAAIATTSQTLERSSHQSTAACSEIATGAEKLAYSATDAAAIMEELSSQTESVKGSSEQQHTLISEAAKALSDADLGIGGVSSAANEMTATAVEGNAAVEQTIAAMARVQAQVSSSSEKVKELDERGKQIGSIVQSIQNIAEQTNLLALNAAIEAARAGEQGRGFAVVADEVRKLAEQAANATREIGRLIEGVTATVAETVVAIEKTAGEAAEGTAATERAGKSLQRILTSSSDVVHRADSVAALTRHANQTMARVSVAASENAQASDEMTVGASRVVDSISGVAAVSEESAAGAHELIGSMKSVSDAATEMSEMSIDLRALVGRFNVGAPEETLRKAA